MKNRITRRIFVSKSIQAAAGASILTSGLPALAGCRSTSKQQLGIALVGLGNYSTNLLAPALEMTTNCKLTGIVTGSPEKIPQWQKKYGIKDENVYNYETMHQAADNPDIDVFYIVVPTSLHAKYSIIAANAGKHVWCEKPMAMTVEECQQIMEACDKNNVRLAIGYRMHHEPNTQTIMNWAETKPYGELQSASARAGYNGYRGDNVDLNYWRLRSEMGGDPLYDMGVYSINGLRYATGMEPMRVVSARHETTRPKVFYSVNETTYFELEFPNGVTGEGATSYGKSMNELRVNAENGWYELSPFQSYGGIQGKTSDGKQLTELSDASVPYQQARQMDNDALALLNNTALRAPGIEGLKDIRIVEAIFKSAKTGQPVEI